MIINHKNSETTTEKAVVLGMSWHDLIDDASVERFVTGGDLVHDNNNDNSGGGGPTGTSVVVVDRYLYETELVEGDDDGTNNEGITIVSSVPTATEYNNTMVGYSTVLLDHPMDGGPSSLSLHPESLDSSVLTESSSLALSEVTEQSVPESPVGTDRDSDSSVATYDNFVDRSSSSSAGGSSSSSSSTTTITGNTGSVAVRGVHATTGRDAAAMEEAARDFFLRFNTDEDWEREKDNIMRIIYAVEEDCKDPDRLLADLFDEEETFWKNRNYDSSHQSPRVKPAAAPIALWDMALIGAVLSLAAAMLFRAVQRGR